MNKVELSDKDILAVEKVPDGVQLTVRYRVYDEDGDHSNEETTIFLSKVDLALLAEVAK